MLLRFLQSLMLSVFLGGICQAQITDKKLSEDTLSYPIINKYRNRFVIDKMILRSNEVSDLLARGDSSAYRLYQKGRKNQKTGIIVVSSGGGLLIVSSFVALGQTLNNAFSSGADNESPAAAVLLVVGGGLAIGGIITAILGGEDKVKAVKLYNQTVKAKRTGFYIKPGITGLSVGLRF